MQKSMFFILASVLVLGSLASRAADHSSSSTFPKVQENKSSNDWKPHIGILAGVNSPEGSVTSTGELGLDVGYQPAIPLGLGIEVTHSKADRDNENLERTALLATASYNFGGTIPVIRYSYVGFGVGPVFKSDETVIASAPMLGFDIPLKDAGHSYVSLGATAKYLVLSGSNPDALAVNGVLKYWY